MKKKKKKERKTETSTKKKKERAIGREIRKESKSRRNTKIANQI